MLTSERQAEIQEEMHAAEPNPHTLPCLSFSPLPASTSPCRRHQGKRHRFRRVPVFFAGVQHQTLLPSSRSSLHSGQIRLPRHQDLTHDPSPWLGFGWRRLLQLRRGSGASDSSSPIPRSPPTRRSASWTVLLHPVAAGRTRAVAQLRSGSGSLRRLPPRHDGGGWLLRNHASGYKTPMAPPSLT